MVDQNKSLQQLSKPQMRFGDLYQSASRTPTSTGDAPCLTKVAASCRQVLPTVLPGSKMFDLKKKRLWLGVSVEQPWVGSRDA